METTERKLLNIRTIDELRPIDGADAIECAVVGAWEVVVKKDQHKVGDKVIYAEIDSWIPTYLAPFLSKGKEPREFLGVKGERLKTIRLRGQRSQGLILSFDDAGIYCESADLCKFTDQFGNSHYIDPNADTDLSEMFGVQKYERPLAANLQGKARGNFPSCGRKTDQERCQNLKREILEIIETDERFEVTLKMDGSSHSVLKDYDGKVHVCSRNLSLELEQEGNLFVDTAIKYDMINKMEAEDSLFQISGEMVGVGIQDNKDNFPDIQLFVYDVFDISTGTYMPPEERYAIVERFGLQHVPILHKSVTLKELGITSVQDLLTFAEGRGFNSEIREGVVFKSHDRDFSFKVISNKFLEKYSY